MTTYEYDDADRLVRSVPESEWDDQQRGWMLALEIYRATRCPLCGGPIEDCGPKSSGRWTVPPPRRCYRTDALSLAQDASNRPRPEALLWRVEKR